MRKGKLPMPGKGNLLPGRRRGEYLSLEELRAAPRAAPIARPRKPLTADPETKPMSD